MDPGAQFWRSDKGFGNIPSTAFAAYREPTATDEAKGAFIDLDHPRTDSYFYHNEPGGGMGNGRPGQQQLFEHVYHPPTVSGLAAQTGMEQHVPALLGLAAQESMKRWGRLPEASRDLSQHSGPMVQHLVNRGIISPPKNPSPENSYAKGDQATEKWALENAGYAREQPVSPEQAAGGSRFLRSVLRSRRSYPSPGRQLEFDLGHGYV